MLRVRRDNLIAWSEVQPGNHDVAAIGRRARQCRLCSAGRDQCSKLLAYTGPQIEHGLEPTVTASSLLLIETKAFVHRGERRPREGAERPCVEIRKALENGEQRTGFVERQATSRSTGA